MDIKGESVTIDYGEPRPVDLERIEEELDRLVGEAMESTEARRVFGRAVTLVIYSEDGEAPEQVDRIVGRIITRSSARAITIRARPQGNAPRLDTYIRAHCVMRADNTEQCAEQVSLLAVDDALKQLPSAVRRLRLRELPLIVWWRAQPDLTNPLFEQLFNEADQMILDSAFFHVPTERFAQLVHALDTRSDRLPLGDLNWARLTPWRELVAQFFDNPDHLEYLTRLSDIIFEYSAREGGTSAQALLMTLWLASMLDWRAVRDSWRRDGLDRQLSLFSGDREITVKMHGVQETEVRQGWIHSLTLQVAGEPPAEFQINPCGGDCVNMLIKLGDQVTERSAMLNVPDEVTLVCSELDAAQQDRVYHRALEVLEQLV